MMQIKVCPKCGSHNLESAWYCANPACGETLAVGDTVEMDEDSVHLVAPAPSQPEQAQGQASPVQVAPPPIPSQPPLRTYTPPPPSSGGGPSATKIILGCSGAFIIVACLATLVLAPTMPQGRSLNNSIDAMISTFAAIFGGGLGVILAVGCPLAPLIFWVWALIDCIRFEPSAGNDKIVWILVILFTNFIGAFLYVIIRRPERQRMAAGIQ